MKRVSSFLFFTLVWVCAARAQVAPPVSMEGTLVPTCMALSERTANGKGEKPSLACAAAFVAQRCALDKTVDLTGPLARYLGVHPLNVHKGLGRYNVLHRVSRDSWCGLSEAGLAQAIGIALTPKKATDPVRASANREYLTYTMADASGHIAPGGYAAALEQRRLLVHDAAAALRQVARGTGNARVEPLLAGLPTSASGWTNLTGYIHPVGRINDVLIDKGGTTSTRTMWAATDGGGIWKTSNGGTTWDAVNDFNGSLSIGKIVRSPRNNLEMYASTNPFGSHTYSPFGVLKSSDGGVTWTQLPQTNPAVNADWQYVTHLAIHPTGVGGADVLLAATDRGAYRSFDSGVTWSKLGSGNVSASFVGFHPLDGNRRAYALNDGSFTITTDGNWSNATVRTLLAGTTRAYTKFAFAASDTEVVYAMASDAEGRTKLLKSTNMGAAWTALTPPADFYFDSSYLYFTGGLWVDPTNANRIVSVEGWAATTANADTATATAGWTQSPIGWVDFHGAVADPEFNGSSNKIIYLMDDGGLYKFNDVDTLSNGSFLATGMTITETYSVAGRGGNIIFGAQDVGPRVFRDQPGDATQRWRFIGNPAQCNGCSWIGDGATTAVAPDNSQLMFGSRQYLDLFRSTDGGLTGTALCGAAPTNLSDGRCGNNSNSAFIAPFMLDPNNAATMLAGGKSLWRSTNVSTGTPIWSTIHTGVASAVGAIAVAAIDSNTIWVAYQNGALYKTTNGLASAPTWSLIDNAPQGSKLKIFIDRSDANVVYLGLAGFSGNTLYVTRNGGTSWNAVAGLPSASVMAMEQHPANPAWLYVGTAVGLFASQDGGSSWSTSNEGPANVQIKDLSWYSSSGSTAELLVASFGRGVWRATVSAAAASSAATDIDKVFAWAEKTYPTVFSPSGSASLTISGYRYRAYASGHFLAVTTTGTAHLYYLGPLSNNQPLDLGLFSSWLATAAP